MTVARASSEAVNAEEETEEHAPCWEIEADTNRFYLSPLYGGLISEPHMLTMC